MIVVKMKWGERWNYDMRQQCQVEDVVRFVIRWKREWNEHVDRVGNSRLINIIQDFRPMRKMNLANCWRDEWNQKTYDQPLFNYFDVS